MDFWIASVAGLAVAYLFGSIPTGYLAGKLLKGIDIRFGSNTVGLSDDASEDKSQRAVFTQKCHGYPAH